MASDNIDDVVGDDLQSEDVLLHHSLGNIRTLDRKFRRACDQILLLNNRIDDLQSRYNSAMKLNRRSFRYSLRLKLATLEGVRNMFYEYASRCADNLEGLQAELLAGEGHRDHVEEEDIDAPEMEDQAETGPDTTNSSQEDNHSHTGADIDNDIDGSAGGPSAINSSAEDTSGLALDHTDNLLVSASTESSPPQQSTSTSRVDVGQSPQVPTGLYEDDNDEDTVLVTHDHGLQDSGISDV